MTPLRRLGIAAVLLLVAPPAYACGPDGTETIPFLGLAAALLLLLASPLVVMAHDLLRLPFGHRPGHRGALVRAVLGSGGAAVGLWGAVLADGWTRLWLLGYGTLCAALLAWGVARFRTRGCAAVLSARGAPPGPAL